MADDGESNEPIPYEELAEIDLDALGGMDGAGLEGHFRGLALRATEGQLLEVMQLPPGTDCGGPRELAEMYVSRRMATVSRLRALVANP